MIKETWEWWLGGVLLFVAAVTHVLSAMAVGQPVDGLAIVSAVSVPGLVLKTRLQGRGADR